jgi:hypothetical protein
VHFDAELSFDCLCDLLEGLAALVEPGGGDVGGRALIGAHRKDRQCALPVEIVGVDCALRYPYQGLDHLWG